LKGTVVPIARFLDLNADRYVPQGAGGPKQVPDCKLNCAILAPLVLTEGEGAASLTRSIDGSIRISLLPGSLPDFANSATNLEDENGGIAILPGAPQRSGPRFLKTTWLH
jgi:hypothetical protein